MPNLASKTRELPTCILHVERGDAGELAWHEALSRARRSGAVVVAVEVLPNVALDTHQRSRGELVARAAGCGVEVRVVVVYGDPATELLRAVSHFDAELLIVGHRPGDAPSLRVVDEVIRRAECPVLIVRDAPRNGAILGGTDLSDPRLPVVSTTCSEAATSATGRAMVAHTVDVASVTSTRLPADIADDLALDAARSADARLRNALRAHPHAQPLIARGPARFTLVELAKKQAAQLLVVGTVGRMGIQRWMHGNLAEFVVRHVTCSVMVVRLERDR